MDQSDIEEETTFGKQFISASDLAEYSYCSTQWYMDKMGYPRDARTNSRMVTGRQMHQELDVRTRNSRSLLRLGSTLLVVSILLMILLALI